MMPAAQWRNQWFELEGRSLAKEGPLVAVGGPLVKTKKKG